VDPLRGNFRRLLEAVKEPVLESEDIKNMLDGYVDRVIEKHQKEDKRVEAAKREAEIEKKHGDTPRADMAKDGKIDDTTHYTKEIAEARIRAFEINYDEDTVKNIEDLRDKKSKKARKQVEEYDKEKATVEELKERFNL
ncbi:MAG: hypothetical protein GWN01_01230, partial [Nitrosopumilaceae archaeon]|nr:hypothetical protein [Nitrosopumilaceae archaeon]NIX60201.1 hypothetical protein [Nitrosopumilaceae archaeon]